MLFKTRTEGSYQCFQSAAMSKSWRQLWAKKVNWTEYNTVLQKLADLRRYVDTMADSIFVGHINALNGQFAKKADKEHVDDALGQKADWDEVNNIRARLERLEVLVQQTDVKQTDAVEALREETCRERNALEENHTALITANTSGIDHLHSEHKVFVQRLRSAEDEVTSLKRESARLGQDQQALHEQHHQVIVPSIASMQEELREVQGAAAKLQEDLRHLLARTEAFEATAVGKFSNLFQQAEHFREQLEFLMQATEMIKRRSREVARSTSDQFKVGAEDHERLGEQVAALERQLKRQERDVRHIEGRATLKADSRSPMLPLPGLELKPGDPNDRLKGVLDQLEKIASSNPPQDQLAIEWNLKRPPLPLGTDGARKGSNGEFAKLQLPGAGTAVASVDTSRSSVSPRTRSTRKEGQGSKVPKTRR
mmetsp:Transcript_124595/g.248620  ORF Transcript_124595/g.248620 Transcript_124595/m.248620 type:complete len:425 (+) Transcript_124595:411-1685(+)